MSTTLWLCLAGLVVGSWAQPVTNRKTTCEDFSRGVSFDPRLAIGNWTTVYSWTGDVGNVTESVLVRELSSTQLEDYEDLFENYPDSTVKLLFKQIDTSPIILEVSSVLVASNTSSAVDGWVTEIKYNGDKMPVPPPPTHYNLKWKMADGFLIVMLCDVQKIYMLSKTNQPDEQHVQKTVSELHIDGIVGGRIYPNLLM